MNKRKVFLIVIFLGSHISLSREMLENVKENMIEAQKHSLALSEPPNTVSSSII